ncbi:DUF2905 domain-containing protein [Patescibacteria group bacterium]|nr:DUF2905 domain-containing protein [Patescibacteria group bacterium]
MLSLMGKFLITMGVVILIIGLVLLWGPKIPFLGKLPGDIYIRRGNFSFYFPLVTCIFISVILTIIFTFLIRK